MSEKMNLVEAFLRGDRVFTLNRTTPSAVVVYNKIIALLNSMAWKTLTLKKTSISALADSTHLRPSHVQKALKELIALNLIEVIVPPLEDDEKKSPP